MLWLSSSRRERQPTTANPEGSTCRSVGELLDFFLVRDGSPPAVGLGEKIERLLIVVAHRRERLVHVAMPVGIALDAALELEHPPDGRDELEIVGDQAPPKARIEGERGFARQSGPAFRDVLEPEQSALQRVHLLD